MRIYTIGHSNRSIDEFLNILKKYGIECVIDVRRFPTSKFEYFKKENIASILKRNNIRYFHFPSLGGFRGGYDKWMLSKEWKNAYEKLKSVASSCIAAIMCAEKLPFRCHRRYISKALSEEKWKVVHIIEEDRIWEE